MKTTGLFLLLPLVGFALAGPIVLQAQSSTALTAPAGAAERLAELVEQFVARDEIVGAEVLVIHRGATVLHQGFGWRDREAQLPMERDTLFTVRSMTKPFTGMVAQQLIDAGEMALDAPVAEYLPSFDRDQSRSITIEHLLSHRSGLPLAFSREPRKPLHEYSGLRELADATGAAGPEFQPGERFGYSDAGSDALGAAVAAVTGQPLESVIHDQILQPLALTQTGPEADVTQSGRRERSAVRYQGMPGSWRRYWAAVDPPLYPFLKGSGGLWTTPRDYARFLQFWMTRGVGFDETGMSHAAFERALTPVSTYTSTTGFAGLRADYGQMWMLLRSNTGRPVGFGHSGSDGTLAFAFPEHDLIVCYFTQSRGTATLRTFEEAISHLFLSPDPVAFARLLKSPNVAFGAVLGLYAREHRPATLGAMIELNGRLAFELPNRQLLTLRPGQAPDEWVPEKAPNDVVTFRRDAGNVTGFSLARNGQVMEAFRFHPAADLPSADEVFALCSRATPADRVQQLLPLRIRMHGEAAGQRFGATLVVDEDRRTYSEVDFGPAGKMRVWTTGDRAWRQLPGQPAATELRGQDRAEEINGSPASLLGAWHHQRAAEHVVLSRERFGEAEVLRVRSTPREGLASTRLIDDATGAVLAELGISVAAGTNLLPVETRYSDFRVTEGVWLPHAARIRLRGDTVVTSTIEQLEPRASLARDTWKLPGLESAQLVQ